MNIKSIIIISENDRIFVLSKLFYGSRYKSRVDIGIFRHCQNSDTSLQIRLRHTQINDIFT